MRAESRLVALYYTILNNGYSWVPLIPANRLKRWYAWQDSNLRPFAPEEYSPFAHRSLKSFRFNTLSSFHSQKTAKMVQKCSKFASLLTQCSRIAAVLIRATVQLGQGLAHHHQFGLAVPLEGIGVTLPEHLGHKMIRNAASTESGGEGMSQLAAQNAVPWPAAGHCPKPS